MVAAQAVEDDGSHVRLLNAHSTRSERCQTERIIDALLRPCSTRIQTGERAPCRGTDLAPLQSSIFISFPNDFTPRTEPACRTSQTGHQRSSASPFLTCNAPARPGHVQELTIARAGRQFVNETFAKCTDANRQAVETELKQAIYHAFQAGDLWSTDWAKYKLDR